MSIWQVAHAANVDVLSVGSETQSVTQSMVEYLRRYGSVIVWMDKQKYRDDLIRAIKHPYIVGIASPKDMDANEWLKNDPGTLQALIAAMRLRATQGDADAIERVIWDCYDAGDMSEVTMGKLEPIAAKLGLSIVQE